MHISDGIIDTGIVMAANVISVGLIYLSGKNASPDEIPEIGMTGAALFVASLVHFPMAGTSLHLGLFGLAGIILGRRAFPAVFTAILFQSLVFQHGGLLSVGINSLNMGAGAFAAWMIWRMKMMPESLRSVLAGFFGVLIPVILMSVEFHLSGYGKGIIYLFSVYLAAAAIEGGISFFAVKFLRKVKPDLLV
jgi:cobalt/nickel transport system permease protein